MFISYYVHILSSLVITALTQLIHKKDFLFLQENNHLVSDLHRKYMEFIKYN